MKFVMIAAACAAVLIVTLGMFGGQPGTGTAADLQILSQTRSPFHS